MIHRWFGGLALGLIVVSFPLPLNAEVGDPTLRTSHPDYPGEGAFQTIEDCVAFATEGKSDPQERALALYHWLLTHQFHLYSPQEWNVPGLIPGTNNDNYEMVVYDANRSRFSYGYGLCGTVHAWNEPYWKALGMVARRRAFPGHVNSEVFYGGGWHAFDTDMAGLIFRRDGLVAGYEDISKDPSLVRENDRGVVCYPFAWPGDFQAMKRGWEEVARGGNWYSMYNSGYAAMPPVVHLRRGETFTRYFDRDVFGGPSKRRFWHVQKDGPFRNWTFVNMGQPTHHGDKSNSRGNASYANAVFRYEPDLLSNSWLEGTTYRSENLVHDHSAGHLSSGNEQAATVIFDHFSPYVICGDPVDDTNPMSKPATDGLIVRGQASNQVRLEISTDQGQSWHKAELTPGDFRIDMTEQSKGRYGWWIRFTIPPGSKLAKLSFETTCQVNQTIYPRLTPNGCEVEYQATSRRVAITEPDFSLSEDELAAYEVRRLRTPNVRYSSRTRQQLTAYTTNNKPGEVVFRVNAPSAIREITAAARYRVRSPQPKDCDFHLEYSTDDGNTWSLLGRAHNADDNEYSSGWMYGRTAIEANGITTVLVKVHLDAGGYQTGLIDFEAYGLHETQPSSTTEVTWAWRVPGSPDIQSHRHLVVAGTKQQSWTIPTPSKLSDAWVEIKVP